MIKVQFEIPLKALRKVFVLIDEDVPSDEIILEKMGTDPIVLNAKDLGEDGASMELGLSLFAIGIKFQ